MLSSKNIAKSLRGFARLGGDYYRAQTMYEAATTIEKQSDEIAALCAEVEHLREATKPITGETSDGYHTFNELYHHRAVLFSVVCNDRPEIAWKARKHHDGTMYDDMFIVGIQTPEGQATYHYDVDPYWDAFRVKALDKAPGWDGHTPAQAIERIGRLPSIRAEVERLKALAEHNLTVNRTMHCESCNMMSKEVERLRSENARLMNMTLTEYMDLQKIIRENAEYKADSEAGRLVRLRDCDECRFKLQSDSWRYYTYPCNECRQRTKDHFTYAALGRDAE